MFLIEIHNHHALASFSVLDKSIFIYCIGLILSTLLSAAALPSRRSKNNKVALAFGTSLGCICLLIVGVGLLLWWRQQHNQQMFFDVNGLWNNIKLY